MRAAIERLTFVDESDVYWPSAWVTEQERRTRHPRNASHWYASRRLRRDRLQALCRDLDHVVARNIRRERVSAGLRQIDLADAIGVTQATISRIESGKSSASIADCVRIAIQLRIPLEALIRPPAIVRIRTGWEAHPTVPVIPRRVWDDAVEGRLPIEHPMYD